MPSVRAVLKLSVAVVIASAAAPAIAGPKFAAYEGPDAVKQGQGGTKVIKNGLDYWTTGSPPRRFQILGVITDKRGDGPFTPSVLNSKAVAKQIKSAGGDGAVILDQSETVTGSGGSVIPVGNIGFFRSRSRTSTVTELLVVRYLD